VLGWGCLPNWFVSRVRLVVLLVLCGNTRTLGGLAVGLGACYCGAFGCTKIAVVTTLKGRNMYMLL
jgi:hypothetical protein